MLPTQHYLRVLIPWVQDAVPKCVSLNSQVMMVVVKMMVMMMVAVVMVRVIWRPQFEKHHWSFYCLLICRLMLHCLEVNHNLAESWNLEEFRHLRNAKIIKLKENTINPKEVRRRRASHAVTQKIIYMHPIYMYYVCEYIYIKSLLIPFITLLKYYNILITVHP